jgi:hypothetical protein
MWDFLMVILPVPKTVKLAIPYDRHIIPLRNHFRWVDTCGIQQE